MSEKSPDNFSEHQIDEKEPLPREEDFDAREGLSGEKDETPMKESRFPTPY